jgi:hypothetical protein
MRERAGAEARVAGDVDPATGQNGAATLYIINLTSSAAPVPLEMPDIPELEGLAVFRSRRIEDGRDRFRMHVGFFESRDGAERVLPAVRRRYPAAWIALAPPDSMGSLDDTGVAQFRFIRQTRSTARVSERSPAPRAPAPSAVSATLVGSGSPHQHSVTRSPMTPAQVLQLLESTPRSAARQPSAAPRPAAAAAPAASGQKFAVQLVWSTTPVRARSVPQLAIFEAYTLYAVKVDRAGRRWYGLRLGFFKDPLSARQVALYARSDFSAAAVVPVSDRECAKATQVAVAAQAITAVPAAPARAKQPADEIVLNDDEPALPAAAKSSPRRPSPRSTAARPSPAQSPRRGGSGSRPASSPTAAQSNAAKRRPEMTAEELLEELGADELGIDPRNNLEELSESGVRHLSVAVVSRQSALARLLERVSRKRDH